MNLARIAWMTAGLAGISLPAFFDRLRIPQRRASIGHRTDMFFPSFPTWRCGSLRVASLTHPTTYCPLRSPVATLANR